MGVVSAATYRAFPHFTKCTRLFLQCADGRWVELAACGEDLEFKFEVFTLHVRPAERMNLTDLPPPAVPAITDKALG